MNDQPRLPIEVVSGVGVVRIILIIERALIMIARGDVCGISSSLLSKQQCETEYLRLCKQHCTDKPITGAVIVVGHRKGDKVSCVVVLYECFVTLGRERVCNGNRRSQNGYILESISAMPQCHLRSQGEGGCSSQ